MNVRTVECEECGETRGGRRREETTVPFREDCPSCGSTDYFDVVDAE